MGSEQAPPCPEWQLPSTGPWGPASAAPSGFGAGTSGAGADGPGMGGVGQRQGTGEGLLLSPPAHATHAPGAGCPGRQQPHRDDCPHQPGQHALRGVAEHPAVRAQSQEHQDQGEPLPPPAGTLSHSRPLWRLRWEESFLVPSSLGDSGVPWPGPHPQLCASWQGLLFPLSLPPPLRWGHWPRTQGLSAPPVPGPECSHLFVICKDALPHTVRSQGSGCWPVDLALSPAGCQFSVSIHIFSSVQPSPGSGVLGHPASQPGRLMCRERKHHQLLQWSQAGMEPSAQCLAPGPRLTPRCWSVHTVPPPPAFSEMVQVTRLVPSTQGPL